MAGGARKGRLGTLRRERVWQGMAKNGRQGTEVTADLGGVRNGFHKLKR